MSSLPTSNVGRRRRQSPRRSRFDASQHLDQQSGNLLPIRPLFINIIVDFGGSIGGRQNAAESGRHGHGRPSRFPNSGSLPRGLPRGDKSANCELASVVFCLQRQNCERAPFLTFKSAKVRSEIDFGAACKHGLSIQRTHKS